MDLSDHWLCKIPKSEPVVSDLSCPRAIARGSMKRRRDHKVASKVVTGRETRPAAANDADADFGISIVCFENMKQFRAHDGRDRVALIGAIQRDPADTFARSVKSDGFIRCHFSSPGYLWCLQVQRGVAVLHRFLSER
jgi:hypothetical protein